MTSTSILSESYSPVLVLLSVLLACVASYVALSLASRLSVLRGRAWFGWWSLGTVILGLGIWSMHFVGMLALHLNMPMTYRFWPTVLSVLPAILASALVLQVASRPRLSAAALSASSLIMGSGIVSMHYLGMNAVGRPLTLLFSPGLVLLSVLIAVLASGAALFLAFSLKQPDLGSPSDPAERNPTGPFQSILASLFLGLGIASMHYTGMWATTFVAPSAPMSMPSGLNQNAFALTVSLAIFALFGLLAAALVIERLFTEQQRQRGQLAGLVEIRTAELGDALQENQQIYLTSLAAAERSHHILNALSEGVMQLDAAGAVQTCNVSVAQLLDLQPDEILGRYLSDIPVQFEDEHDPGRPHTTWGQRLLEGPRVPQVVGRTRTDGSYQWLSVVRHDSSRDDAEQEQMIICMTDVTEQRESQRKLYQEAYTDALTGLANRRTLYEILPELLLRSVGTETSVAVLFVDLDQFKVINDSVGHSVGDQILREVGRRLSRVIRKPDVLVRMGGDEFCVVLDGVTQTEDAVRVAERLHRQLSEPITYHGGHYHVGASIGISVFPDLAESSESLLRQADLAMYRVKRSGRGGTVVFRPEIEAEGLRQAAVEQHLRDALLRDEFTLVYQPLVHLPSGQIRACEALLRWQSAELGPVSPAEFIPIAEQAGLIYQIDEWVIREACAQAVRWKDAGQSIEMAVNISAVHVQRTELVPFVRSVLRATGLRPEQLKLELTEGALILDMEEALRQLHALRQLGVQLSLDDFGTGYSSLSWLQSLPIEQLKLDRSLLDKATEEPRRELILASFIALAQTLGMTVVAEGIETAEQLALLRRLGCDYGQGYFLSRPLPSPALFDLLGRMEHFPV